MSVTDQDSSLQRPQRLGSLLLTILFLFAPFYYQQNLGGEGLYLPYNSTLWIAALLVITAGVLLMVKARCLILPRQWLWLSALPAGLLISGLVIPTERPIEWMFRIGYVLGGFVFLVTLFQFRLRQAHIFQILLVLETGILVHTLIGYVQLEQIDPLLGFVPRSTEPVGIFQQRNLLASISATGLLLGLYLRLDAQFRHQKWFIRLAVMCSIALCTYMIIGCGSRVGLISALAGGLLIALSRLRQVLQQPATLIAIVISLGAGFTLAYTGNAWQGLQASTQKLERINEGLTREARIGIYEIGVETALQAPVFGHGLGSFQKAFQAQRADYMQRHPDAYLGHQRYSHPHNELLLWLIEGGVVAVLGIMITAAAIFWRLYQLGWHKGAPLAALLIPITLHTQLELPFYICSLHWFVLLLFVYCVFDGSQREYPLPLSSSFSKLLPVLTIIGFATLSSFFVHTLYANAGIVKYLKSRQTEPVHLQAGLDNIYLHERAQYFMMRHLFIRQLITQSHDYIPEYIRWAEDYLAQLPQISLYVDLASAYAYEGNIEKGKALLNEGLRIYPQQPKLTEALAMLNKNQLPIKLRRVRPSSQGGQVPLPASPAQSLPAAPAA